MGLAWWFLLLVSGTAVGLYPARTSGSRSRKVVHTPETADSGVEDFHDSGHQALPGFCLTANQACVVNPRRRRRNMIGEFNETYNTIGCAERCEQAVECQYWTWWGEENKCQIFVECLPSTDDCKDCQTGPRSCGLWDTSVAAISGGLANDEPPNRSEVTLADWQLCNSSIELPRSRWGHVSLSIGNNYIVCGGTTDLAGYIAPNETCDIYDIVTRRWTTGAPMAKGRHAAAAVDIFGQMFVIGGIGADGELLSDLEIYEPASRSWRTQVNLTRGLAGHCVVGIRDLIVVTGGLAEGGKTVSTVYVFNTTSKAWSRLPGMQENRAYHGCSVHLQHLKRSVDIPEIIVTGGVTNNSKATDSVEIFSFSSRAWRTVTSLPRPLAFHTQVIWRRPGWCAYGSGAGTECTRQLDCFKYQVEESSEVGLCHQFCWRPAQLLTSLKKLPVPTSVQISTFSRQNTTVVGSWSTLPP